MAFPAFILPGNRLAQNLDFSAVRVRHIHYDFQQRALSGTVIADQCRNGAGLDRQADRPELKVINLFTDIFYLNP